MSFERPPIRFARTPDDAWIAYQELGEGEPLLVVHPAFTHVDREWDGPYGHFMRGLALSSWLITFDKRGMGLSDRFVGAVNIDARIDEIGAVLDATGVERVSIFGWGEGAALGALFAATCPDRVKALVAFWPQARTTWAVDYPWGEPPGYGRELFEAYISTMRGDRPAAEFLEVLAGDAGSHADDPSVVAWASSGTAYAVSPGGMLAYMDVWAATDVRDTLPGVRCPTLILTTAAQTEEAAYFADLIPGSRIASSLPGEGFFTVIDFSEDIVRETRRFLELPSPPIPTDRVLATVMFTDIVDSTRHLSELGDSAWKSLLSRHDEIARDAVERFRGRYVHTTGDGLLATFDGPARAVKCAIEIADAVRPMGFDVRAGAHTGEVELLEDDVSGLAVHIGARVAAKAGVSEVWCTSTVKDLTAGSGLSYEDAGQHELKGVPDTWHLYRVVSG